MLDVTQGMVSVSDARGLVCFGCCDHRSLAEVWTRSGWWSVCCRSLRNAMVVVAFRTC